MWLDPPENLGGSMREGWRGQHFLPIILRREASGPDQPLCGQLLPRPTDPCPLRELAFPRRAPALSSLACRLAPSHGARAPPQLRASTSRKTRAQGARSSRLQWPLPETGPGPAASSACKGTSGTPSNSLSGGFLASKSWFLSLQPQRIFSSF